MTQQPPKKQPKKKAKPLGDAIPWTDKDLDDLAAISPADLKAADAMWKAEAPKPLQGLLGAKVQEEGQGNEKRKEEAP